MSEDFNPAEIFREVLKSGEDWADRKAAYEALDENSKSILADITTGYMKTSKSKTEAEMYALASEDFKQHLRTKQDARRAFLRAQVTYNSQQMLADLRRSEQALKRAEMTLR